MTTPLIEDGCVVVEGERIVEVGAYRDLKPAHIDHDIDGVLMPGLINAHTHLELTNINRPPAPISFVDWILNISQQIRGDKETFAARREAAVRQGIAQCIKFGVTCVGDITQNVDIVRPILREGPIRSVSFGECLGIGERRWRFEELLRAATDQRYNSLRLASSVSPHAPYTVDAQGLEQVRRTGDPTLPLAMHLAETRDEDAFVCDHSGALGEIYTRIGIDPGPAPGVAGGAIWWAWEHLQFGAGDLLVHMNYVDDSEMKLLEQVKPTIVWCPRTHRYFGHAPHRWREMRERRIPVLVGTDSCASSPDLNIVDDLRLLHEEEPGIDVESLWRMITINASGFVCSAFGPGSSRVGAIAGSTFDEHHADFAAFPTRSADPLREILETRDMLPSGVWIGGVDVARATST